MHVSYLPICFLLALKLHVDGKINIHLSVRFGNNMTIPENTGSKVPLTLSNVKFPICLHASVCSCVKKFKKLKRSGDENGF